MVLRGKTHQSVGVRRLAEFDAKDLIGAPFPVILHDSVDEKYDTVSGEVLSHIIPNVKSLVAAVAVLRVTREQKLNGEEIRFLRKSLARRAKDFAENVGISPEQLSRYENNKQPISLIYERILRASVCLGHFDEAYQMGIDMRKLLTLKIKSARLADNCCAVHLHLVSEGAQTKPTIEVATSNEPSWRKTG
jgi:transcriptional regulator with XRE-family HTH domain